MKDSDQCISNGYLFQLWTFQIRNHSWFFGLKSKDIKMCRNILFWNVFIENRMKRVQILPLQLLTNRDILQFWVNTWVNLKPLCRQCSTPTQVLSLLLRQFLLLVISHPLYKRFRLDAEQTFNQIQIHFFFDFFV